MTLASALLESDRRYFELGATVEPVSGAVMAWMPGMGTTAAGCVVHRVRPAEIGMAPERWVEHVTDRLAEMGCSTARVYLDEPVPWLETALRAAGYRDRVEIGYLAYGCIGGSRSGVSLRPILDEADWEAKRKLHAGSDIAADGHATPADDWVQFERRKCDSGGMAAFLIEVDGEACGGIATLESDGLLRAKNAFVHPDRRREGIAAQAMRLVSQRAGELGKTATGVFGVDGNPGNAVYVHLAMAPVVRQYEWARSS